MRVSLALLALLSGVRAAENEVNTKDRGSESSSDPITMVIKLLQKMKAQVEKEGEEDAELCSKMGCWCKSQTEERTAAIEQGEASETDLNAKRERLSKSLGYLGKDIEISQADHEEATLSISEANELRLSQNQAFVEEAKELADVLGNVNNAILVISKWNDGAAASFVQNNAPLVTSLQSVLRDAALQYEMRLAGTTRRSILDEHKKTSFLQKKDATDDSPDWLTSLDTAKPVNQHAVPLKYAVRQVELVAKKADSGSLLQKDGDAVIPVFGSYNSQSGVVFGLLEQLANEFSADLKTVRAVEKQAVDSHQQLTETKMQLLASIKRRLNDQKDLHLKQKVELQTVNQHWDHVVEQLKEDRAFLQNVKLNCDTDACAVRADTRDKETRAITEAMEILMQSDPLYKVGAAASFIQVQQKVELTASQKAAAALRAAAESPAMSQDDLLSAWHNRNGETSPREELSALAVMVESTKMQPVLDAIDNLISDKNEESAFERKKKVRCETELSNLGKSIFHFAKQLEGVKSELDALIAVIEELKAELSGTETQINSIKAALITAAETRGVENRAMQETVANQESIRETLAKAVVRLNVFYEKSDLPPPDSAWNGLPRDFDQNMNVKPQAGASAVQMLQEIITISSDVQADAVAYDKMQATRYASNVRLWEAQIVSLKKNVQPLVDKIAVKNLELAALQRDYDGIKTSYDELVLSEKHMHDECDFLLLNFDIRMEARRAEIAALYQAKGLLEGSRI